MNQLTVLTNKIGIAWHWRWSLTWRWILSYSSKRNDYHRGLYLHKTYQGRGMLCGLNASKLGSIHFQVQPNMRKRVTI